MSDIAERLLKAIKAAEDMVAPLQLEGRFVGPRTDAERATLRRCAADRETVELYVKVKKDHDRLEQRLFAEPSLPESDRKDLLHCKEVLPYLYAVLANLARGYGLEDGQ